MKICLDFGDGFLTWFSAPGNVFSIPNPVTSGLNQLPFQFGIPHSTPQRFEYEYYTQEISQQHDINIRIIQM